MPTLNSIMLIDDDPITNLLNRQYIKSFDPEIEVSEYLMANEALTALMQPNTCPDIIFLDINMPEMDGWEFLEELQRLDIGCSVMMLSSSIDQCDINKSRTYPSVKQYISKPLTNTELEDIFLQVN